MKKIIIILSCLFGLLATSCDDFLDVRPKAEKLERELFKNARGFEDAIYGVYGSLQMTPLYGMDLLWGVPEVLAQNLHSGSSAIEALGKYDYTENSSLRARFAAIWTSAYQTIGYANNILEQLNNWSPNSLPFYNYYKGEMLGVRAFMHFDLLRLFAPMDMQAEGIPYVKSYSYGVKPFYKVNEVYSMIIEDLKEAEELLLNDENIIIYPHNNSNYNKFENFRETHFNLYAVRALLARVYWMKGDMKEAASYAENVIASQSFPLVTETEVRDYLAGKLSPKETIFGIYSPSYIDNCESYLYKHQSFHSYDPYDDGSGGNHLLPYTAVYNLDVEPGAQDFRRYHFNVTLRTSSFLKLVDYYTIEERASKEWEALISGVTLIHISEMYLIAAEALLDTDYSKALSYFDTEIASRGLIPLSVRDIKLTKEIIYNEYRKELFGEGQMWYNMKRLNKDIISNSESRIIPASDKIYVIPIPEEEYEYRK